MHLECLMSESTQENIALSVEIRGLLIVSIRRRRIARLGFIILSPDNAAGIVIDTYIVGQIINRFWVLKTISRVFYLKHLYRRSFGALRILF